MAAANAARALIRDDKIQQVYSMLQSGQKYGMKTLNMSLAELYLSRKITIGEAMSRSSNVQELNEMLSRVQSVADVHR